MTMDIKAPELEKLAEAINNLAEALSRRCGTCESVHVLDDTEAAPVEETQQNAADAATEDSGVAGTQAGLDTPDPALTAAAAATIAAAPAAPAPAPAPAREYTLPEISMAGASLLDMGRMDDLLALLADYGVQAITQLKQDQWDQFAGDLQKMGAKF